MVTAKEMIDLSIKNMTPYGDRLNVELDAVFSKIKHTAKNGERELLTITMMEFATDVCLKLKELGFTAKVDVQDIGKTCFLHVKW